MRKILASALLLLALAACQNKITQQKDNLNISNSKKQQQWKIKQQK